MVKMMKSEYDFSHAVKAKFYTPVDQIEIPIYLDKAVNDFYKKAALSRKIDLSQMVNSILKKEMEIHKDLTPGE